MKRLTVPAVLESLSEIAAFVRNAADAAGLDRRQSYRLRLSVDELATNIIRHGNVRSASDPSAPATIDLRAEWGPAGLTVTMEDNGAPFDPRQIPPPDDLDRPPEERRVGGLGVYLALKGVDRFAYERVENRNRNILTMNRPQSP